jgi:hypothetical protein
MADSNLLRKIVEMIGPGLLNKADGSDGTANAIQGLRSGVGGVEELGSSSSLLAEGQPPGGDASRYVGLPVTELGKGAPVTGTSIGTSEGTSALVPEGGGWQAQLAQGLQGVSQAAGPQGSQQQPQAPPITPMQLPSTQGLIVPQRPLEPYQRRRRYQA